MNTVTYTFKPSEAYLASFVAEKLNSNDDVTATSDGATITVTGVDDSYGEVRPLTQSWLGAMIVACIE